MAQEGDDCYFYYYSSCKKGSTCPFRHEPLSRGTETICEDWEFGRCLKKHCEYRHMRIQVNRSTIPCYWESQPAGCQKPHCVFQHGNGRNAVAVTPTQAQSDATNVPSPKVEQILIHMADTDEESPQKGVRLRTTVTGSSPNKKISLIKQMDKKADSSTAGSDETLLADAKHSSQHLEDELLEFAKQGICMLPNTEVVKSASNGSKSVKVKSLKDIKREKILKARLEYERKKLLASQQTAADTEVPSTQATRLQKTLKAKNSARKRITNTGRLTHPPSKTAQSNVTRRLQKPTAENISSQKDLVAPVEVSSSTTNPVAEVRVKSFSEIMEEKRRRQGSGHLEVGDQKGPPEDTLKKPVIAPRRIKLHTAGSKKPVRLKRKALSTPSDEVLCKVNSTVDDKGNKSNGETGSEAVQSSTEPSVPCATEDTNSGNLQTLPVAEDSQITPSNDNRLEIESDDELNLLDGSSHFKADSTLSSASDLDDDDDDDFMNEMEQLLA